MVTCHACCVRLAQRQGVLRTSRCLPFLRPAPLDTPLAPPLPARAPHSPFLITPCTRRVYVAYATTLLLVLSSFISVGILEFSYRLSDTSNPYTKLPPHVIFGSICSTTPAHQTHEIIQLAGSQRVLHSRPPHRPACFACQVSQLEVYRLASTD